MRVNSGSTDVHHNRHFMPPRLNRLRPVKFGSFYILSVERRFKPKAFDIHYRNDNEVQSYFSRRLAQIGVGFGLASAFGITLVANFQEPNLLQMHAAGAFLVFGLGAAYLWIEVIITFQISNGTASARRIIRIRTVLAVINSSSFGVTIIALKIALDRYITNSQRVRQNWWPEDGGHDVHVVSAFAEWIVALTQMLFFTTYSCEFRKYKVTFPKLVHRQIATTIPDTIRYRSIIQPEKKLLDTAPSLGVLPAERPSILDVRA